MCLALATLAALATCGDKEPHRAEPERPEQPEDMLDTPDPDEDQEPTEAELAGLLSFENTRRASTEFRSLPPSDIAFGPNPHAIAALPSGRLVGALRGAGAVVMLDGRGKELARANAPTSPGAVAISPDGHVFVSGEGDGLIRRYRVISDPPSISEDGAIAVPGAITITDIAVGRDGVLFASEEANGRVFAIRGDQPTEIARCHGPIGLRPVGAHLAVNCLLDHSIDIYRLDAAGAPSGEPVRIRHRGPIWGMSLAQAGDALYVALSGVEDRELDRTDGGFGYIDSFAFVYRVGDTVERLSSVNVSELGVVTPKWLDLQLGDRALLVVAGYGSDKLARLSWPGAEPRGDPESRVSDFVPGTSRAARSGSGYVASNAILDAWVYVDAGGFEVQRLERAARSAESHVGERLFFTTLMASWNSSDGKQSRFTCETCHYEGYIDGRTHYTGRDDAHATTKPLLGLFNNRPHFTRALDRSMAKMVHNEFKVANKFSGKNPWFQLSSADFSWLGDIESVPETMSPVFLRRSLMTFLMEFSHRPNPAVRENRRLTSLEKKGAAVLHRKCERCHSARLITDDPSTSVPFDDWEKLVLSPEGPIVWASAEYHKTGVTPYVHEDGARTTSLRRLYKKWPYFTNGKAGSIDDVLARIAIHNDEFFHDRAPPGAKRLSEGEKRALAAFLRLL